MEEVFEFVVDICIIEMVQSQSVIHQVMVLSVSLCKTRTYEQVKHEHEQLHTDININDEIIIDLRYDVLLINVQIQSQIQQQVY